MRTILFGAVALLLAGCSGSTTSVSTKATTAKAAETFWAKNSIAEQTEDPGSARFEDFTVYQVSNGDRIYCGSMSAKDDYGVYGDYVPFYMRGRGQHVLAVNAAPESAKFSARKCADAKRGSVRINNL
ncbi:hypothetical protein [Shimia biformata]|uniref:hypothetical protein n=1 Tax=Shimia biformata TaxID=1294299 RepID=UPI001950DD95|nr:hypothetical protein [Shimia biformata]